MATTAVFLRRVRIPSRELDFDQNDFDQTLPGPWEWDVKRLAASFSVAASEIGLGRSDARDATSAAGESYRTAMARFGASGYLALWYERMAVTKTAAANPGRPFDVMKMW